MSYTTVISKFFSFVEVTQPKNTFPKNKKEFKQIFLKVHSIFIRRGDLFISLLHRESSIFESFVTFFSHVDAI